MKEPLIAVPCNAGAQLAMKYAGQELDIGKTLASFFLLGEDLSYQKLASIGFIVAGIALLTYR
jgi:hypothetical protein